MRILEHWMIIASFASFTACSSPENAGCAKDADCKGARICKDGQCVEATGSTGATSAAAPNSTSAKPSDPASAMPIEDEAKALLKSWLAAQTAGDVEAYKALYDSGSFSGVRRTSDGKTVRLKFDQWHEERAKMVANKPTVEADRPVFHTTAQDPSLPKGTVTVSFVQRWKSGTYADHGPKLLRLAGSPLRITYEELLSSAAGWSDADNKVTVADGTSLQPPIAVTLVAVPSTDQEMGALSLLATDAKGIKVELPLGRYWGLTSNNPPAAANSGFLYKVSLWFAGAGDEFNIVRDGTGISVKHRWLQEVPEDEAGKVPDRSPFTDLGRLTLKPGVDVTAR